MRKGMWTGLAAGAIALSLAACGGEEAAPSAATERAETPPLPATQDGRIAFALDGDLFAIDPADGTRTQLTKTDDIESQPVWSPDGRRLAFIRGDGGVYVMNADGSAIERVTEPRPEVEAPDWSPDGERLAFGAASGPAFAIYVVNVDGTGLRRVLKGRTGWLGQPDWSPDGKRVAFSLDASEQGGEMDVYVARTDGRGMRRVTKTLGDDGAPDWSKDGRRILYGSGGTGIFTIKPDGTGRRRLSKDPLQADALSPVWSPGDEQIAYTGKFQGGGSSELYVMKADGTGARAITDRLPAETPIDW